MRILQVVTTVGHDGAFGGPVTVATNQSRALMALGHSVTLFSTSSGLPEGTSEWMGVPARLQKARRVLPGLGFSGITSFAGLRWLRDELDACDLVHVHLARDLVTLPAAWLAQHRRVPYVVQCHGMVDPSNRRLASILDSVATRRVLSGASAVLFLTATERAGLIDVAGQDLPMIELPNGVPAMEVPERRHDVARPEVIFCARLQARKRPDAFVEMARILHDRGIDARYRVCGPDEGMAGDVVRLVDALGLGGLVDVEGAVPPGEVPARLGRATVFVLPSVDEPFPMTILESLAVGTPVVTTSSNGLAPALAESGAGIVTDGTSEALADAVQGLLDDADAYGRVAAAGRRLAASRFSMDAVVHRLGTIYADACSAVVVDSGANRQSVVGARGVDHV
jgi:glycosyltransferase involved in cell wall biosynthesis